MVRSMNSSGRIVDEEGFFGRHGLLEFDPIDRLVGHIPGEVIVGVVLLFYFGLRRQR